MLATRSRILSRLSSLPKASSVPRRFIADQPQSTQSTAPRTPATNPGAPSTLRNQPTTADYNHAIPIPKQQSAPKMRDGYSGVVYLSILGGLLVSAPVIIHFYWEHRKIHMREKKEAILKEIQVRHGVA